MAALPENFSNTFLEFHLNILPMDVHKTLGKNILGKGKDPENLFKFPQGTRAPETCDLWSLI